MKFLKNIILILALLSISSPSDAKLSLNHDGTLRLYVYHLSEAQEIQYLDQNGAWIPEAYDKINKTLRSRGDDATITMDKRLIELADHLQDHFKVDTIEVISGFRSTNFNQKLKSDGRNVANKSFHTKGLAMDIHIDEIKETTLRDYLLSLKLGGVGYYGNILMVHMDFGPVREWHSGDYRDNVTIGIFNKQSALKLTTNKLFYGLDSQLHLSESGIKQAGNLKLQQFQRGAWVNVNSVPLSFKKGAMTIKLKEFVGARPYGKFRLLYKQSSDWQHSNEFYIKRI